MWSQATEQGRADRPVRDLICSMLSTTELFRLELGSVLLKITCETGSHLKALFVYNTSDIIPSKYIGMNIITKSCFLKHSLSGKSSHWVYMLV